MIPYGRQQIDEDDIEAVVAALRSPFITTGPAVREFENAVAEYTGAKHAVAVSNGTAALHAAVAATGIGPGDEVIVSPMTFAATANAVLYCGGTPVFADVDPETLLLDPKKAEQKITPATKAIIAIDYAGQTCDYEALRNIAEKHGLMLIADAAHSLGATDRNRKVGTLAGMTTLSFHPVKHITTGEGGMILTDSEKLADFMWRFRAHGVMTDYREREKNGDWFYEMAFLGYNYRITDLQCALGISQLKKLNGWLERRRAIAARYDQALQDLSDRIRPLRKRPDSMHAYHLYVVRVDGDRNQWFRHLREQEIGVNVHYIPVHLHPYYQKRFNILPGLCPVAEDAYRHILSLPMYPGLNEQEQETVIQVLRNF